MNKRTLLLVAGVLCIATQGMAQFFMPPITGLSTTKPGTLTAADGTVYENCKVRSLVMNGAQINRVNIMTAEGEKLKFKAEDVASMQYPPSELAKFDQAMEATTSVQSMFNTDFDAVLDREIIYYEANSSPRGRGKTVLMQLVNPGFESKIAVFNDPWAGETMSVGVAGMTLAGGLEKSYYVRKDGEMIKVQKKGYGKMFDQLFADCPRMAEEYPNPQWKNFATHVFAYDQWCE
ncbi:MAG TPA: hypothetical protein DCE41_36400 [Cytophagales bacterium]|nr:hypothetical protein [Cytophagales bacterium]HAA23622.1 hypothetical protein [Cytophagales bacterium]HAP64526.1 hypothetical protein [Cytophagales bacterium]